MLLVVFGVGAEVGRGLEMVLVGLGWQSVVDGIGGTYCLC